MDKTEYFALVTGASSGIGKAIAFELASRGYNLLLISLPAQQLSSVGETITEKYLVKAYTYEIDLSLNDGPRSVHNWVLSNNYNVNILVNNAGCAGTSGLWLISGHLFSSAGISSLL